MKRESEFRYLKLANILREQILSGFIKPGEYLMSENELCRYYGISRTSVRKSLEQLAKEGLIIKKVGQGTIVSPDLVIDTPKNRVLRIVATSPSHFFDICMPSLIERFKAEHPNVDVKCLSFSIGEFWDSVSASSDLGLQPDLVFVTDRQFGELEQKDRFIDLRDRLPSVYDELYPRLRDAFTVDGKWKAVPVTFSTVFLAYNPELFRKYGVAEPTEKWTREQFLDAARRLTTDTNGDGILDLYGLTLSSAPSRWPVVALQNGVNFKQPDRQAIVRMLTMLHDLLYRHQVATLSPRYTLNSDAFVREKAAMVLTTAIELAGWVQATMKFTAKVAPLPFGDKKDTMLIANAFMVPADSNEPELAARFLQMAVGPEMQEQLSRTAGFISVLPRVNEKIWNLPALESLHLHREAVENSYFLHEMVRDMHVMDELDTEMMLFWSGLESAEEFADRMTEILSGSDA